MRGGTLEEMNQGHDSISKIITKRRANNQSHGEGAMNEADYVSSLPPRPAIDELIKNVH